MPWVERTNEFPLPSCNDSEQLLRDANYMYTYIYIRRYVATWDSPSRGISTLQQQDVGAHEIVTRAKWTATHSKSESQTLRENIQNAGNLREREWHEWEWLNVWVRKTMHSFISLLRFEFSKRKNTHPYFFRNGDITPIFAIFCLIERFETILSPCRKVSNVLSTKEIFLCDCWLNIYSYLIF